MLVVSDWRGWVLATRGVELGVQPVRHVVHRKRRSVGRQPTVGVGAISDVLPTLPSVDAAHKFHRGEPGGMAAVVGSTVGRACLIGIALAILGERARLVRYSLGGATMIELFVLLATAPRE